MEMKYLFIVTELESANGICVSNVMKCLVESGAQVFCLTNREHKMPKTYSKDGVVYFTVKQRFVWRIDSYLRHNRVPEIKKKILKGLFFVLNKLKLALSIFTWPLISPLYCKRYYIAAKEIVSKFSVDCIIPVYKQIDPMIVTNLIKRKNPQIITIPYFLDSLSGGIGPKVFSKKHFLNRGLKWEKRVLSNADAVFVMESSRKHHERYNTDAAFFNKLIYLDIPMLKIKNNAGEMNNSNESKDEITVLYCGTLTYPMRNVPYLINVLSQIKEKNIKFIFIGNTNVPHMFSNIECVTYCSAVSHDEAIKMMKDADILLNIGVKQSSAISGKIFEYMSFGKPIISTYSDETEACFPYLDKYPLKLMIDERDFEYRKQAEKIVDFIRTTNGKRVDYDYIMKMFYRNTPESFVEQLQKVIGDQNEICIS